MGEVLLESLLYIIFGIIQFLFLLPGELAIGMANGWKVPLFDERRGWAQKSLAVLISLCFWSIAGLSIYFLTAH
jgi:hypothetical protein